MTSDIHNTLQEALGPSHIVERELTGGGMSRVFVVEEVALRRRIVVKMLPPEMAADMSVARFEREIQMAARLQHPHIVPLLSTGAANGLPYYTMPFVEGESLREQLTRSGELPVAEAVRLLREIATALAYAHDKGIVHRDIKPENVLITGGVAMVTDFGVAKALQEATNAGSGALTAAGMAIGTPAYMSPEQVSADPAIDYRADLYSLGVMAYEMLSGQPPFSGRTAHALLAAHISATPESLGLRRAALPASLSALVMRCLEKRPADRPQDAREFVQALDAIATPTSGSVMAPSMRWWKSRMAIAGVLVLLLAGTVVTWRLVRDRAPSSSATLSSRVLVTPFANLTGDTRFDYIGRIVADRLTLSLSQAGSMDAVPSMTVIMAMRDTTSGMATVMKRLSIATHAGLMVSGTVVLRGDSVVLQGQVTDVRNDKVVVSLDPATGSAADPLGGIDAFGDRLLSALGRHKDLSMLPQGFRAPKYAAYQEFAAGYDRFAVAGDNKGSRAYFARAIALDSTYVQAYALLARQYINAGEFDRADSLLQVVDRLPVVLTPAERLQFNYHRADMHGDLLGMLTVSQQMVARDSSGLFLYLLGEAATMLLRPATAIPALEQATPTFGLFGGQATRNHTDVLALAYHQAGRFDRELKLRRERESLLSNKTLARVLLLAPYAGLHQGAMARATADSVLHEDGNSTGGIAIQILYGALEFRAHGDSLTAAHLMESVAAWFRAHPAPQPTATRSLLEGLAYFVRGKSDSAAGHFALAARDTSNFSAIGLFALTQVAMGKRDRARTIADSLGQLHRTWMRGANTYWRAAISGALGERELAVRLLAQSSAEGVYMSNWHVAPELDPLRGYAPFEELIRPRQ